MTGTKNVINLRRWIGLGAAVLILVASWYGTGLGVTPDPLPGRPANTVRAVRSLAPQGAGSCAATACHGSVNPAATADFSSHVLRNEHTTWITQDRHANAYKVLFSRRSEAMATKLSGGKVPAHKDTRCLSCHSTGGSDSSGSSALTPVAEVVREDGVSCESCHGASEIWLGAHTQIGWNSLSPVEKETRFGMRMTKPLERRAALCAECHVGSPGRDVNHDLIAAGHPRLSFEFSAFLANMPPHWVENTSGNFPARAWAIGQAVTARAAIDLLDQRARMASVKGGDGHGATPWPEFSEYDCFACHHDLADEAWRKQAGTKGSATGLPAWGTWYYPMALELARASGNGPAADLDSQFGKVRTEMNRFGSDPDKVSSDLRALSQALSRWLQTLPDEAARYDPGTLKKLIAAAEQRDPKTRTQGWDGAAQRYLALQPLRLALKGIDPSWADGPLKAELDQLFRQLQFPGGYDSPRRFDPAQSAGGRARRSDGSSER